MTSSAWIWILVQAMDHDAGYKQLFSHPQMVADLLRGFVREPWVEGLDLDSLERVSECYIAEDLRKRANDLVWRLPCGDNWLYV